MDELLCLHQICKCSIRLITEIWKCVAVFHCPQKCIVQVIRRNTYAEFIFKIFCAFLVPLNRRSPCWKMSLINVIEFYKLQAITTWASWLCLSSYQLIALNPINLLWWLQADINAPKLVTYNCRATGTRTYPLMKC